MPTVMIVDDHADLREVVAQLLDAQGLDVICCASAEQAMHSIATHGPPCAMVIDLRLPGQSGLDLLRNVRSRASFQRRPVVVYSADDSQRDQVTSAGADEFWLKGSDAMFDGVARLGARLLAGGNGG